MLIDQPMMMFITYVISIINCFKHFSVLLILHVIDIVYVDGP